MKKANKKLLVTKQTVRDLTAQDASLVNGGTQLYYKPYEPIPNDLRPRCTYHLSGCTSAGR